MDSGWMDGWMECITLITPAFYVRSRVEYNFEINFVFISVSAHTQKRKNNAQTMYIRIQHCWSIPSITNGYRRSQTHSYMSEPLEETLCLLSRPSMKDECRSGNRQTLTCCIPHSSSLHLLLVGYLLYYRVLLLYVGTDTATFSLENYVRYQQEQQ